MILRVVLILTIGIVFTACEQRKAGKPEVVKMEIPQSGDPISNPMQPDTLKGSPQRYADMKIGDAEVSVRYHSPAVRGRIIWGGLVPYHQVWVTGAHMATAFHFSKPVLINGSHLETGTYALFTIPSPEGWTVIFNRNHTQHLTDEYDAKDDVLRLQVQPLTLPDTVHRLTYDLLPESDKAGRIRMRWEKLAIELNVLTEK